MHRHSIARIAQVSGALVIVGAIIGGLLGAGLVMLLDIRRWHFTIDPQSLSIGAQFGALAGAVLAPVAAWTLMRRVPIWRAIADTAAGTVLGAVVGMVGQSMMHTAWLSPVFLGVVGFAAAAIRLRIASPTTPRAALDARAD